MADLGSAGATIRVAHDRVDELVVRVAGELDMESVAALGDEVAAVLALDVRPVAIDASGLTFMDSSGVAVLLRLAARFGPIEVRDASAIIRQIIRSSGVAERLVVPEGGAIERQRHYRCATPSVREARRFVVDSLQGVSRETLEIVEVLVSELATNAVRHAETDFDVTVTYDGSGGPIRVEVVDAGAGVPTQLEPGAVEPQGRGLKIVNGLSDRWGCTPAPGAGSKTVWFELVVPAGAA